MLKLPPKYTRNAKRLVRRLRHYKRHSEPGAVPGAVIPDPEAPKPIVRVLRYDSAGMEENTITSVDELRPFLNLQGVLWIDIDGLGDAVLLKQIGEQFGIHLLVLEDIVNVHQRPKLDLYDGYVFLVMRMPIQAAGPETEQLSMIIKGNVLLTFQEIPGGDPFDPVRDRLRRKRGYIRERGVDYLMYALLDGVIDSYFPVLDHLSDRIEQLELEVLGMCSPEIIRPIHLLKQDVLVVRRAMWPLRELLNRIIREQEIELEPDTRVHLKDCYDHTIQIVDLVETYRELCSDLVEIYHSQLNQRMNEIIRLLTVISTIFMPLTFIAGIYGMNFDGSVSPYNMPELRMYYGYPAILAVMLLLGVIMLTLFRVKRWW